MKNSIVVVLISAVLAVACSNDRETVSGQKFSVLRKGDGKEVDNKKFMVMSLVFKDAKDSVWADTRKNPYPWVAMKESVSKPGDNVYEVISMLSKGDSVTFKVSALDLFIKSFHQPLPRKIDSASLFTFFVGVSKVLDSAEFMKYREDIVAKQDAAMQKQQSEQLGKDTVIIDNFLKEKNIVAKRTTSGLRYVVTKFGVGANAKDGQKVKANYAGYLLDGKYFDTNIESVAKAQNINRARGRYAPLEVFIGRGGVIQGWEEALKLMNKGSKMTVYIPSTLAYGNRKMGPVINENSVLIFDMELVDIE